MSPYTGPVCQDIFTKVEAKMSHLVYEIVHAFQVFGESLGYWVGKQNALSLGPSSQIILYSKAIFLRTGPAWGDLLTS
jgi:hypothetical protein